MFSRSTATFDRALEKSTSHLLLEPDWEGIITACDSIRSGETPPKYAATAIKKKLYASNPHVSLFALQVLESCMKNCGGQFHSEVATKAYMDDLRDLVRLTNHDKVKERILELIQVWAHAFRNEPTLGRPIQETVTSMRNEGFKFPTLRESDAMFSANSAPQWADADNCHRCGTPFSLMNRKHHCRACGQIFCGKCSAKASAIPKFGIEKEVRVCDSCFDKLNKPGKSSGASSNAVESSPAKQGSKTPSAPAGKSEQELQEEEELQMALALSQSEADERKERERRTRTSSLPVAMANNNQNATSAVSPAAGRRSEPGSPKIDAELSRYLDRAYWEQKPWVNQDKARSTSPAPSAPMSQPAAIARAVTNEVLAPEEPVAEVPSPLTNGTDSNEIDNFLSALRSALEIFVNRMNSNKLRGRPIANDSAVQSLFLNITNMHSQLLHYMQEQDEQRVHLESLQDKLTQIRDARAALDALREEHQIKLRLEAEEAERIRQQQMAEKLEIMRKKKQEYLQYQRQIALQRIQEQQTKYQWPQQQPPMSGPPPPQAVIPSAAQPYQNHHQQPPVVSQSYAAPPAQMAPVPPVAHQPTMPHSVPPTQPPAAMPPPASAAQPVMPPVASQPQQYYWQQPAYPPQMPPAASYGPPGAPMPGYDPNAYASYPPPQPMPNTTPSWSHGGAQMAAWPQGAAPAYGPTPAAAPVPAPHQPQPPQPQEVNEAPLITFD